MNLDSRRTKLKLIGGALGTKEMNTMHVVLDTVFFRNRSLLETLYFPSFSYRNSYSNVCRFPCWARKTKFNRLFSSHVRLVLQCSRNVLYIQDVHSS